MSLSVLLLMNSNDSAAIKTLLKSKIPGYAITFAVFEQNHANKTNLSNTIGDSPEPIDFNLYDVCVIEGTYAAHRFISRGVSAIRWDKMEDLSVKFDVFLQLHRYLKKFPLDLPDWNFTELLHNSPDCIIYKGIDTSGSPVAIKRFKFQANQLSQDSIREYLNSISLQCAIKCQSLVDFYIGGIANDAFYLVMEYLPLGNLRRFLDSRDVALSLNHALEWFEQIARALGAVHHAGLIHRDLKIDNIMLRDDGSLALTDYGVSKNILLNADFLNEDEFHGSPYYVSPELIAGEPCSQSSDIYSLGIIFYELLTGVRPYNGNNSHDLMMSHMHDPIPSLADDLDVFKPLLDKMMAKSPEDRFINMDELLAAFTLTCKSYADLYQYKKTPPHF